MIKEELILLISRNNQKNIWKNFLKFKLKPKIRLKSLIPGPKQSLIKIIAKCFINKINKNKMSSEKLHKKIIILKYIFMNYKFNKIN